MLIKWISKYKNIKIRVRIIYSQTKPFYTQINCKNSYKKLTRIENHQIKKNQNKNFLSLGPKDGNSRKWL